MQVMMTVQDMATAQDYLLTSWSTKQQAIKLSAYVAKNMKALGVYYQIWEQRYYMAQNNIYGPANTWNLMPDRGGATANHYDHVHISFNN